jgi:transglutaminase-like putative cysteine protease
MNESEKQFSFTRAAPSTSGHVKNQIRISLSVLTRLSLSLLVGVFGQSIWAQCDLGITSGGPCLVSGANGTPSVGDVYSLHVIFTVVGTPMNAFRIKFTLANATGYSAYISGQNGWTYAWQWSQTLPLDDAIPWSITLDPDGVSGDTDLANNVISGIFTPTPPSTVVELYSPRIMQGSVTSIASFQANSGTIPNFYVLFGEPSSHGAQSIIAAPGPANAQSLVTAPYGIPVFQISRRNVPAATFHDTNSFIVQLSRMRVNPTLLRAVTWNDMNTLTTNWTEWLRPTPTVESTNVLLSNFVQQALPPYYQSVLTPYDTARTLHRAVMKKLTYGSGRSDAVGALQDGVTDCVGFASLLTACLRNVGVPARVISGFCQGDSVWHERVEFHLPGSEWLLADPTFGNDWDSTGTYAYYFGYISDADSFMGMDVGELHVLPYTTCDAIQQAYYWYNGGTVNSFSGGSSLQEVTATGQLQVTINPMAAVTAGARWQIEGGALENNGATISSLPPGNYVLTFTAISGWTTPANQTVSVTANHTTTATCTYVQGVSSSQPTVAFRVHDTNLVFSWSTNFSGFSLESTTNLLVWARVPVLPAVSGMNYVVTNGMSTGFRFFRLIK